jgi:hypothetical protein
VFSGIPCTTYRYKIAPCANPTSIKQKRRRARRRALYPERC